MRVRVRGRARVLRAGVVVFVLRLIRHVPEQVWRRVRMRVPAGARARASVLVLVLRLISHVPDQVQRRVRVPWGSPASG